MFGIFYKLYFIRFKNSVWDQMYLRFITRFLNYFFIAYFSFDPFRNKQRISKLGNHDIEVIVSLTSFPKRIDNVWMVIESILRQTVKPDRIILWLYQNEFESINTLPKKLLNLQKRGLEIRFCQENLKPHKKYFFTMKEYPSAHVITIDDDFIYHKEMINNLLKFNKKYPNSICCYLTRQIVIENNTVQPYSTWKYQSSNTIPAFSNLTMGGSGCLFPPGSLHEEVNNLRNIKLYCLTADDLWLKIMSLLKGTKVIGIGGEYKRFFLPILINHDSRLMDINIGSGQNDIIFHNLLNNYNIDIKVLKE